MKIAIILTLFLQFIHHSHCENSSDYQLYDPLKLVVPFPEEILKYLDYIEFIDPEVVFRNVSVLNDSTCNNDVMSIFYDLRKNEQWPKVLIDSIDLGRPGILNANRMGLGNFDECLSVRPPNRSFTGQYCLMYINDTKNTIDYTQFGLFWFRRPLLYQGICIPSTCSREYVIQVLQEILIPLTNQSINDDLEFGIEEGGCHTIDEKTNFTVLNWITIGVVALFTVLIILSSFYDWWQTSKNKSGNPLLISFSFLRNIKHFAVQNMRETKFSAITGIKALSTLQIVFAHIYYFQLNGISLNPELGTMIQEPSKPGFLFISISPVDSFLFVSGILVVISFMNEVKRSGHYDPVAGFTKRYLRLMSPVAFLILIRVGISEHFDNGPIYNAFHKFYTGSCNTRTWSIFLIYDNFIENMFAMCNQSYWYIVVDLQLFIATTPVLLLALWKPRQAGILSFILCAAAVATEFTVAYIYDLGVLPSIDKGNFTREDNIKPYTRATPWFGGMVLAFILREIEHKKIVISKKQRIVAWLFFSGLFWSSIFPVKYFELTTYTQPWSALYLSLRRIGWCAFLGWLIFVGYIGYEGFITNLLTSGPMKFYSTISFELYLVNVMVVEHWISSARSTLYLSLGRLWLHFFPILTYCTILSVLLGVTVTVPVGNIITHFQPRMKFLPLAGNWKKENDVKVQNGKNEEA